MKEHAMTKTSWVAMAVVAVLLTACGGGDDDTPPVTESVPASASASATGFIDYLKQLVVASADMLEPVDVSAVTPPTDEASEPTPIN